MTTTELTELITDISLYGYDSIRDIVDYSETIGEVASLLTSFKESIDKALLNLDTLNHDEELIIE